MTFNSLPFVVLLAIVLALYFRLDHRWQNRLLLAASYTFYGWWDYRFLALLMTSTTVDFLMARAIDGTDNIRQRRAYLAVSLVTNLSILGFFKYFGFFTSSAGRLLTTLGLEPDFPTLNIILPIGISFYTFQSLSYTIDVYRRQLKPARTIFEFALYLSFFPQLVAGPIERATHLLPQIQRERHPTGAMMVNGAWLILLGYTKKLVIADRLSLYVDYAFSSDPPPVTGIALWLYVYAFAFQIYADFSGYTDIARGLAKILGFDLMMNFRAPYFVTNPSQYWRNWHISLSTWLRDYLYIPLGGNRLGPKRTYLNLFATMLLGGLWHGAGWAYVLWGLYHGLLLSIHRFWVDQFGEGRETTGEARTPRLLRAVKILGFFQLTCLGWLVFRVGATHPSIDQISMLSRFFTFSSESQGTTLALGFLPIVVLCGALCLAMQYWYETFENFQGWSVAAKSYAAAAVLVLICGLGVFEGGQFIYFQF